MSFSASHLRDAQFEPRGLRSFFECRDLGIKEATGGKVLAHVIRAKPGATHGDRGRLSLSAASLIVRHPREACPQMP